MRVLYTYRPTYRQTDDFFVFFRLNCDKITQSEALVIGAKPNIYSEALELVCGALPMHWMCPGREESPAQRKALLGIALTHYVLLLLHLFVC